MGLEFIDEGTVIFAKDATLGYLEQEMPMGIELLSTRY